MTLATTLLATAAAGCNTHDIKPVEIKTSAVCDEDSSVPVVRPKVMLVLDRSGSMTDVTWDHDRDSGTAEVTRWFSLHGVVSSLVDVHGDRLDLGATLFPSAEARKDTWEQACIAPTAPDVPVGAGQGEAILAAMPDAAALLEGATPATSAYLAALDHLTGIEGEDPRVMVLVTDGVANCSTDTDHPARYDSELREAVQQANETLGITTYVVGIGISSEFDDGAQVVPHDALDEVAAVGGAARDGTAAYYDVFDEVELQAALDEIAADLGCTLVLEADADPEREVLLSVDAQLRDQLSSCDEGDGWAWLEGEAGRQLQLCGQACTDYQASGEAVLDYDCSL